MKLLEELTCLRNVVLQDSGQEVIVKRGSEHFIGIDRGIDEKGNLLLDTGGVMQRHNAGEVSLRPISDH